MYDINFIQKINRQIITFVIYSITKGTVSPTEKEKEKMERTLKAYKNTKTLEVIIGYRSRKRWKQIKEDSGKPSDWKRINPKDVY